MRLAGDDDDYLITVQNIETDWDDKIAEGKFNLQNLG